MEPIEIITIIIAVLFVSAVIALTIRNKKKGKTSCGCDCAHCKGCAYKNKSE